MRRQGKKGLNSLTGNVFLDLVVGAIVIGVLVYLIATNWDKIKTASFGVFGG